MLFVGLGLLLVPFATALFWQEYSSAIRYGIIMFIFFSLGMMSLKIEHPKTIQSNEAFTLIALTFVLGSLALTFPMMANGLSFIDSWFECVSGVTTTGLSVVNTQAIEAKTFFFSRAWMQWYGGLGIVIFSLGLAMQPSTLSRSLLKKTFYNEDLIENSKIFARKILLIYCALTLIGVITLKLAGLSLFDAVTFTFSSISTGGFSSHPGSLSNFSFLIQSGVLVFAFLGAVSFPLFWLSSLKDLKKLARDTQLGALVLCCLVFTLLVLFLFAPNQLSFIPTAFLNVISLQSTAGYSTFDLSTLNSGTKLLLILSMFIGGSTQSTAGGFKLMRLLILLKALHLLFFRTSLTKSADKVVSFAQNREEAYGCLALFSLYVIAIFLSTGAFVMMGYDPLNALFDVVSAIGTVGASSGFTGPELPAFLKGVLIFDMFLGRLEIVTLLVLIYPKTFIGRRMMS